MPHNIGRIHPLLTQKAQSAFAQSAFFVIWCLDYHGSLLVGLPAHHIHLLQLIQDVPAGAGLQLNPQLSDTAPIVHTLVATSVADHRLLEKVTVI